MTHIEGLRTWARGSYPLEAGTEILVRFAGGRFAQPGQPWIKNGEHTGAPYIDFACLPELSGELSGGERRVLMTAASIAGNVPVVLGDVLPGMDREGVDLVLAAIAHAAGSHEHSGIIQRDDGTATIQSLPTLYEWPKEPRTLRSVRG